MEMKKNNGAIVFVTLLAALMLIVIDGVLFSVLWGWFVVPLGVRDIGAAHGIGLAIMLSSLRIGVDSKEKSLQEAITSALGAFIALLILMLIAFFAHLCM